MHDQGEHRNKRRDKTKRNKGFPYRKLRVKEQGNLKKEKSYERVKK